MHAYASMYISNTLTWFELFSENLRKSRKIILIA